MLPQFYLFFTIMLSSMNFSASRIIKTNYNSVAAILQRKLLSTSVTSSLPSPDNANSVSPMPSLDIEKSLNFYSDGVVSIRNTQRKYRIDLEKMCFDIQKIKKYLHLSDFQLDVLICSDSKMRTLNEDWRGKAKSTDILSAPLNDFIRPGVFAEDALAQMGGEQHLGDIAISPAYVKRQCLRDQDDFTAGILDLDEDRGVSKRMATVFTLEDRLPLLLIHGILHMIGYDHETDEQWLEMTDKEDELATILTGEQQQQIEVNEVKTK